MAYVTYNGTREDVQLILRRLMAALGGDAPDPYGVVTGLQLRCANVLLSKIQKAFLVKSRGGVGSDGIKWQPLTPAYKAYGRRHPGLPKPSVRAKKVPSYQLTPEQRKKWWRYYGEFLRKVHDKSYAAALAWTRLKNEEYGPGLTLISAYQSQPVDILRDTGELFKSLSAGKEDQPSGAAGNITRTFQGVITVGTNKKPWHHRGVPGKLPARPFWPPDGHLPPEWWEAIQRELTRGLMEALIIALQRGGRP